MFRVLTAFLLLMLIRPGLNGQDLQSAPAFKSGRISPQYSLLNHRINHPDWQSARFGSDYFVVVRLNHIPDPAQRTELANHGIILEHWISGNNWLAICTQDFHNRNNPEWGINNI